MNVTRLPSEPLRQFSAVGGHESGRPRWIQGFISEGKKMIRINRSGNRSRRLAPMYYGLTRNKPERSTPMKILFSLLFAISTIFLFQPAWAGDPVAEARGVFAEMVTAAKASDMGKFKSYILPKDLAEMEQMGMTPMIMNMMAGDDPAIFKPKVAENYILFTHVTKEEGPDSSMTMTREVYMIKHDGQWKFGTPQ